MTFNRNPIYAALVVAPMVLLGSNVMADAATDAAINDQRIKALEAELNQLKRDVTTTSENVAVNQQQIEESRPEKEGTKFTYGGFIQLDAIYTDYEEGKPGSSLIEDFLVPSQIPVENADSSISSDDYQSTNFHAKTSRFFFTTSTDTDVGNISTRIELDFILSAQGNELVSNSEASRLRHAFVKWQYGENSSILAGQTWGTFFNVGALPDLQDFIGPVGTLFNRQPMIRWSPGPIDIALENPINRFNDVGFDEDDNPVPILTTSDSTMPDIVLRYNGKMGSLGWSLAAIGRELSYEDRGNGGNTQNDDDSTYGYGLSLAGKWMIGRDDIRFMFNYGNALGRYMGVVAFEDGYIDADGKVQTFDQYGGFIAYRHLWSDHWRSNFSLSMAEADNPSSSKAQFVDGWAKTYQSAHVNLQYVPTPALMLGGEFVYATKELEDGRDGALSRFQFSVKYGF